MIYSYKVHVINRDLNLDKSYKNVVQVFNPITHTKDYTNVFTNDEVTFTEADADINFDLNDGVHASICLNLQPSAEDYDDANIFLQFGVSSVSLNDALSRQYLIIQEVVKDNNGNTIKTKLYFYFIVDYEVLNENLIKYELEIDAFMTYPLYSDIEVNKTKIERAHTNRFITNSTLSSATFNLNNGFLETGEPLDNAYQKIRKAKKNTTIKNICGTNFIKIPGSDTVSDETINNIINNTMWLYVMRRRNTGTHGDNLLYFSPYYEKKDLEVKYYVSKDYDIQNFETMDATLLYYYMAENAEVYKGYISPYGVFGTINNNITGYRIAYLKVPGEEKIRIIFVCEFEPVADGGFDNYNLYNTYDIENPNTSLRKIMFFKENLGSYFYLDYNDSDMLENDISYFECNDITLFDNTITNLNNSFDYDIIKKAEIKTKIRNTFNEYKLKTQFDTAETILDLNIIKTPNIKVKIINNLNPANEGDLYITLNDIWKLNFGITSKIQYAPLFYSDKFKEYQAQNKNYRITGQAIPIVTGTLGGAIAGAKIGGVYGAGVGAVVGAGTSAYKVYTNFDNMQNTPDAIKMKGQNITIDQKITPSFVYIEHNELRDEELKAVNMYFYEFGYTINEINDLSNFFTRSSFNYIQTEDCEKDLHALINKNVLDIIIKALNNGVRFWTPSHFALNKFNYTTNNLEKSLLGN